MTTVTAIAKKSLNTPDEVRRFDKGRIELLTVKDVGFARAVFEPGWKWSDSVKPIAGTESCHFTHKAYIESGSLRVRMDNGEETDVTTGDVVVIAPGHDAWVTSDEPCVMYDFSEEGADYAKHAE